MNPTTLILNNNTFSYEQIKRGNYIISTQFEEATLLFCQQWLNGQQEFEQKTSGSTGKPKLIKITRAQMELSAKLTVAALKLKPNDKALVCIDTAYIGGKMMLVRALEHQLQLIIQEPSSNPLAGLKQPFDFAAMVPIQIGNSINTNLAMIKKCKAIIIGGAPVSHTLANQLAELSNPIFSTYGMTETVSHIALKRISKPIAAFFTTLGDVKIRNNKNKQLVIHGAITNHKELITNDRVEILSPTTFNWLGRIDNVVNSGGVKIQLEEIENKISTCFQENNINNRFFLYGVKDKELGTKLLLCLEADQNLNKEELLVLLKINLPKYGCPKQIVLSNEFSLSASGKILRKETIESAQHK